MHNNSSTKLFSILIIFFSLLIGGCITANELEIDITGVDTQQIYTEAPDFTLDYARSAQRALENDEYEAFHARLASVRVELNAIDITSAFDFSNEYATIKSLQAISPALRTGLNTLIVKQDENSALALKEHEFDRTTFKYSVSAPYASINTVKNTADRTALIINGFIASEHPVASLKVNGIEATVNANTYSVTVPKANNYVFIIRDNQGKSRYKRFSDVNSYIEQALRIKIVRNAFNTPALREKISQEIKTAISGFTGSQPLVDTEILGAPVEILLENITIEELDVKSIRFEEQARFANIHFGLIAKNPNLTLIIRLNNTGLGRINVALDTLDLSANVLIGSDANNRLDLRTREVTFSAQGITLDIPPRILPDYITEALPELLNSQLSNSSDKFADAIKLILNQQLRPRLAEIQLAAVLQNTLKVEGQITRIQSTLDNDGVPSIILDIASAVTAADKQKFALGFLSTVPVIERENPIKFKAFNAAVTKKSARTGLAIPDIEKRHNIGLNISAELINLISTNLYRTGAFNIDAYYIDDEVIIAKTQPENVSNFDLRFRLNLQAPPEVQFSNSTDGDFNTEILLPNVSIQVDIMTSQWQNLANFNLLLNMPANLVVDNNQLKLESIGSGFHAQTLHSTSNNILQIFVPIAENIINTQIPLLLSQQVSNTPLLDFSNWSTYGLTNFEFSAPQNKNLGIATKINVLDLLE